MGAIKLTTRKMIGTSPKTLLRLTKFHWLLDEMEQARLRDGLLDHTISRLASKSVRWSKRVVNRATDCGHRQTTDRSRITQTWLNLAADGTSMQA